MIQIPIYINQDAMSKTDYKNYDRHDQEHGFYFGKHQSGFMGIFDGWIPGEKRPRKNIGNGQC